jgi:NAD(P)-dependent dehydrogenase (short-subunit alcohol dehydrogenase family)
MTDGPLLAGKVGVVTGGSRGIGRAVVLALAGEGADVAFSYRSDAHAAQELVRAVQQRGRRALAVAADARDPAATERFVETARSTLGRLDVAVANAGVAPRPEGESIPLDLWRETLETNLVGAYELVRAVRPRLTDGAGSIVLVSSVSALLPYPRNLPYAASKAGLLVLVRSLAPELAPKVRLNAIAPGWVRTDLNATLHEDPAAHDRIVRRIPRGRWGEPDDIAAAVVFLLSDGARFMTGESLVVDGGNSVRWSAGVEG